MNEEEVTLVSPVLDESMKEEEELNNNNNCSTSFYFWISLLLFPFLYTFQPSSSFLVSFLVDRLHIPLYQVDQLVLPTWTYAFLASSITFGLVSPWLGKWTLVLGMLGGFFATLLVSVIPVTFGGGDVFAMVMASEVLTGMYSAGEIMYSSFLYNLSDPRHYQRLASVSRSMRLLGVLTSSALAQVLLSQRYDKILLFYISAGCLGGASLLSMLLPFKKRSNAPPTTAHALVESPSALPPPRSSVVFMLLEIWRLLKVQRTQQLVLFLFVCNAIHPLALTYWQSLFLDIDPNSAQMNAYLFSGCNLLAFGATLLPIVVVARFPRCHLPLMIIAPFFSALLLAWMGNYVVSFKTIWPSYVAFLLYHAFFEFMLVLANAALATMLKVHNGEQFRAVLFGLTYGTAVGLQAIIQALLQAMGGGIRFSYIFLAGVHLIIPLGFLVLHPVHHRGGVGGGGGGLGASGHARNNGTAGGGSSGGGTGSDHLDKTPGMI